MYRWFVLGSYLLTLVLGLLAIFALLEPLFRVTGW